MTAAKATNVQHRMSRLLESEFLRLNEPLWYKPVLARPPAWRLAKMPCPQLKYTSKRSGKNMFKPQKIIYPEDRLRARFYRTHPWELARPKIIVENDGMDFLRYDWKTLVQHGRQTDGESVVQRTLWLMKQLEEPLSEEEAYKKACKEFYALRAREDTEIRVAEHEARAFGTQFSSFLDIGLALEDRIIQKWRYRASRQTALFRQRKSASVVSGDDSSLDKKESEVDIEQEEETEDQEIDQED